MAAKASSKEAKSMQEFTYKQQEYGRMIKRSYFLFNDLQQQQQHFIHISITGFVKLIE